MQNENVSSEQRSSLCSVGDALSFFVGHVCTACEGAVVQLTRACEPMPGLKQDPLQSTRSVDGDSDCACE